MYSVDTERRKCGVWMDHAEAHVRDVRGEAVRIATIENDHESRERFAGEGSDGSVLGRHRSMTTESVKNARKAEHLHEYYERLAEQLREYDDIYVFGPTTAPQEFTNNLRERKAFETKHITTESADYLSAPRMLERVRKHYHIPD
ncbi:MAG: hypothetical protein ACKOAG_10615 [Candidatus Kapaibacterium sp.]